MLSIKVKKALSLLFADPSNIGGVLKFCWRKEFIAFTDAYIYNIIIANNKSIFVSRFWRL